MKKLLLLSVALGLLLGACGGDRTSPTPTEVAPASPPMSPVRPVPDIPTTPPPVAVVAEPPLQELPVVAEVAPVTYGEHMKHGLALAAAGDHAKARVMFEAAAKLDTKQAAPHVELARSYITAGERAGAIKSATKAVKLAPSSSQAWNTLGRAELLRHSYDAAVAAFTKAVELDDTNLWAWNNLGYTHLQRKEYELAITALLEATAHPKATGYMFNNLGSAYEQLDELDDARAAFTKGGDLGSVAAASSRKRLEGVDTVVTYNLDDAEPPIEEELPAPVDDTDDDVPVDAGVPVT